MPFTSLSIVVEILDAAHVLDLQDDEDLAVRIERPHVGLARNTPAATGPSSAPRRSARRRGCRPARSSSRSSGADSGTPRPRCRPLPPSRCAATRCRSSRCRAPAWRATAPSRRRSTGMRTIGVTGGASDAGLHDLPAVEHVLQRSRAARVRPTDCAPSRTRRRRTSTC